MAWIKKVFFICCIVFALISFAIGSVVFFYGDEIKEYAYNSLKSKLNKEIRIGETSFAGISHFPNVGLNIEELYSPGFKANDTLLFAKSASLSFNLIDILRGKIEIDKIELRDAHIYLEKDKNGNSNFDIANRNDSKPNASFAFNKLKLLNVTFDYVDQKSNTKIDLLFENLDLKGKVKNEIIELFAEGTTEINSINTDGTEWVNEKTNTVTKGKISYNTQEKSTHFYNSEININDNAIIVDGSIIALKNKNQYQLSFNSDKIILEKAILLVPNKYKNLFANYDASGIAKVNCTISGSDAVNEGLITEICFSSNKAKLNVKEKNTAIKFKNLAGCYTWNPDSKNELLNIKEYAIDLDGETIKGSVEIKDFNNPYVKISSIGTINLETANKFLLIDTIESVSGTIKLNMSFEGNFNKANTYKSNGSVQLQDVTLAMINNPLKLKLFNGLFNLKNNDIEVKDFSGNLNESDVLINGTVTNLYNYIFLGDNQLRLDASLSSKYLDLNTIWNSETKNNDTTFTLDFSEGLDINLALNLSEFYFKKFEAENVIGKVQLKKQILSTQQLSFNGMDGSAILKGKIDASKNNLQILSEVSVSKLDINKLFYQVGNFGQDVVVYQNLKGIVTADLIFNSVWSKTLEVELDKVYAKSDFIIENGALIDFEPMLALSKYVKGTDLKHVSFSTLTNSIEIENQTIYFPMMEIKSSALNIIGSGTHTFNNEIDYKIQLLISELLGKKVKEQNSEFGEIEDDGLGRSKLYLTMKGTVDDPKFAIDKKSLSNKIAQDIKQEKQELRKLLHNEFGKEKGKENYNSDNNENANSAKSGFELEDEEEDFEMNDD